MAEHGAALQTYNLELVKCLEELKNRRNSIAEIIAKEETERKELEGNIKCLQDKLNVLDRNLEDHKKVFGSYSKTIAEAERGFKKILESSQALLNVVQLETEKIDCSSRRNDINNDLSR